MSGARRLRGLKRADIARLLVPSRLLLLRGPRAGRTLYLTFDDGPEPTNAPAVLDALRAAGAHATFFFVGREVERHPAIVRRAAEEGHAIGNHSYSHGRSTDLSLRALLEDVKRGEAVLERASGVRPRGFRPPYGALDLRSALALWATSRRIVFWNVEPRDNRRTAAEIVTFFREHPVEAGDVILLHSDMPQTAEALPDVLAALRARGFTFGVL
jgi:peptidoglycan/xylan/chitin deacetylase (PgdA/CDA1 family)